MVCLGVTNFRKVSRAIRYIFCDEKSEKDAATITKVNTFVK